MTLDRICSPSDTVKAQWTSAPLPMRRLFKSYLSYLHLFNLIGHLGENGSRTKKRRNRGNVGVRDSH